MAHDALERGTTLKDKYRIEERLGAGGMAVVYRAKNVAVDRTVAIKVLNAQLAHNDDAVRRFRREARAANQARHPNIVDVLDVDQDGDMLFIVQEYLEGEDFAARLRRDKRLSVADTLAIMLPVAEAVGAAHDKGVVHRDLKPDNVFLVRDGDATIPKILDFGISKMPLADFRGTGAGDGPVALKGKRITVAGVAMGTPYYMSPEQIRDPGGVDRRTDVWAIGVMMYEALAGAMPFDADDMGQLFAKIHTVDPRRLDKLVSDVSPAIAKVVHRCMRVDPDERYATANELAQALERACHDIDDEPSIAGQVPSERPALASSKISEVGSSPLELELDVPHSSRPGSSQPSGSGPPHPISSGAGLELELDLPKPSRSSGPAAPSHPAPPVASAPTDFDDDDDDDALFGAMDLAVEVPGRSSQRAGPAATPRIGVARERSPDSRRRIHMRQHAGLKQTGNYVRFMLAGTLLVSLALGSGYLTPAGMAAARTALGPLTMAAYGGAAGAVLVALVLTASHGLRLVAYSLFLASIGLTALLLSLVGAMVSMFAPGLGPGVVITIALFIGNYAAIAAVAGYALFAAAHGRTLRAHDDERLLGNLLLVAAVLVVGAGAWIANKPTAPLVSIQNRRANLAEPLRDEAREMGVELVGGHRPAASVVVPLRTTTRGGAAVGHVDVPLPTEDGR